MGFHHKPVGAGVVTALALLICVAGSATATDVEVRAVDQPITETHLKVRHFVPPTDKAGGGSLNCELLANNPNVEPALFAAECGYWKTSVIGTPSGNRGPTDPGWAQDIGFISDNFVTFQLGDFPGQTVVGQSTNAYYGMDFDPSATTLWAINDTDLSLGTIDLATGAYTPFSACANPEGVGEIWTGLTIDPGTGAAYTSSALNLYSIDLANPTDCSPVLIGPFNTVGGIMIDIAMNAAGELYGHDMGDDSIHSIDVATGAATLIGPTGFDAGFAQGMDFDNTDGTLYIALYQGGGANVYGTVDLGTGAVTPLAQDNPLGEFEMATQTAGSESLFCNGPLVEFEDGIPLGWTNLDNGGPFAWTTTADAATTPNGTGGSGEAATADSDAFNGAGDPYDAELWTNPFDLSAATAASMNYLYNFNSLDTGDFFDIDITTNGGGAWTNLVSYADDSSGPGVLDLSAYAGLSDVQLRFRYYGDSWDWYAQVDELALSCSVPSITMTKTVGTVPGVCAATDTIVVPPGTDVYYCYTVTNTGNVTLGLHDLVDDQLGTILDDFAFDLLPGESAAAITAAVNITTTTVNVATWTAFNPDPVEADESESTDSATVVVLANDTCDNAIELTCPQGGGTFSVQGSTLLASFTGEFFCDTSHNAPEIWYRIMGNGGDIEATTCSAATNYDTKLSVFDGGCGSLNCVVGIDDDPTCQFSTLQSTVNWTSVPDVEYQIMVHGFGGSVGDFELTITCDIPVELQSILVE